MTLNFDIALTKLPKGKQATTQIWYIVREGRTLRVAAQPDGRKVVRQVVGKRSAADRELKRLR